MHPHFIPRSGKPKAGRPKHPSQPSPPHPTPITGNTGLTSIWVQATLRWIFLSVEVPRPRGGCSTYLCYAVWHLRELSWMGSLLQVVLPCAPSRQARSQQPLSLPLPCRPAE